MLGVACLFLASRYMSHVVCQTEVTLERGGCESRGGRVRRKAPSGAGAGGGLFPFTADARPLTPASRSLEACASTLSHTLHSYLILQLQFSTFLRASFPKMGEALPSYAFC